MPRGGFRGGYRGGYGRRGGAPLIVRTGGLGMGGVGMGGMGSPLLTGLMTGGLGYLLGRGQGQAATEQVPQAAPYPAPPPPAPAPPRPEQGAAGEADRLAQLRLLGELHAAGTLTDEEFAREKARLLRD